MQAPVQSSPNPQMPQQSSTPPQIAPKGMPQAQPTLAPQHAPSGRAGQAYNPQILAHIEQHLTQLPDQQKAYLVQYMTPELAIILGIIIGQEAYDYFQRFADPAKMLVVQPRPQQQQQSQPTPQQGQAQSAAPQQAPAPTAPVSPQPKSNTPQSNIMGV